ncbi:ABC transporter ATP-binding protein [Metabacillus sediminilitoris]|uniref:ABC transporter ATP-binding protein n=1 Tax=Metabacillus sediminilitoris TaxID=2567941 RepID=A0A4S4C2U4_9BACI|nr:ABC transporter ATP-binding protein [Metabacillus sediminilitoris]QGQ47590.1 ATP-binding cassette domain-containing protein [Metabacillus sediminilitoris]THF82023.1 ABC transporter ATP-binding protein [Metabacillus sediminilitoris]
MIEVRDLSHSFKVGKKGSKNEIPVLKNISLTIKKGEIASIVGRSGSGKSTLLNLISGYISPTAGEIIIKETNVTSFNEKMWAMFRLDNFGFIFQSFQLIQSLTTFENVELPLTLKGISSTQRKKEVLELLESVGLHHHADHYPNELSGGQQQRVSIARALITKPSIILADEPTGSLDSETEKEILDLIKKLNEEQGITFFIITHDEEVAKISNHQFHLQDGVLTKGGAFIEV